MEAPAQPTFDSGAIAWILISSALVLFMTPGLAFFYGGMVRSKNMLGMLMQNFFSMGLVAVLWSTIGFTIAFGPGGKFVGDMTYIGMKDMPGAVLDGYAIPLLLFAVFQMTFAIITPALITGATADRLKFSAYVPFIGIWLILVYAPVAHWVWSSSGWIYSWGALDFAGGAVVHINAGIAALVLCIILGKRKGWPKEGMPAHNLPWTMIGTGILWFGWAGFNAGSALAADGIAVQALMNTIVAPAAAMLGWLITEKLKDGHPTTLGAASGAVAGMVAITPCAGFVNTMAAIAVGLIAGSICFLAIQMKYKFGYDDSLDVVGVHLVGGLTGSLLLGLFADAAINPVVTDEGLLLGGGATLLMKQAGAALAVLAFSGILTAAIALGLKYTIGLRVTEEQEDLGLDLSLHKETAYHFGDSTSMGRIG